MKLKTTLRQLTLIALVAAGLTGCQIPETEVQPEYAFPLVDTRLSIEDVLNQANTGGLISVDGDKFMTLNYEDEVLGTDTVQLIKVPGFSIPQLIPVQTIPVPFPSDFDIDKITVKGGKLFVRFTSVPTNNFNVTLTVPSIKQGGNSLTFQMNVEADGGAAVVYEDSISLVGYQMDFSAGTFTSQYTATDAVTNLPVVLSNFMLDFPKIDFSYIEGYFGVNSFVIPTQTLAIEFFEQWRSGKVSFVNPTIRLRFDNSYGFPLRVNFDTLQVITRDAGNFDITSFGLIDRNVNYPSLSEVGQEKRTNINLNNSNSNLIEALEKAPYGMRYQFSGIGNPNANPAIKGFSTDASRLTITVIAELPFEGAVDKFTLVDTFDLDLDFASDGVNRGSAEFKIVGENGFPLDINLQAYFLDYLGQTIDSMFLDPQTPLMQGAGLDANGRATAAVKTTTFADFPEARFANLVNVAKKMVLIARFNSPNSGSTPIKIYSDYDIGFKIGVKVKPRFD
jgi:hypothetical protein